MTDRYVTLNHGAGGHVMRKFIQELFAAHFDNAKLAPLADAALIEVEGRHLAFTTDSYVVKPVEFPGGNIGKLAVCGTINDLAVMAAHPRFLSTGFIIEEGFEMTHLRRIVESMAETAREAGVIIVTGDTKVVPRGECDGLFINTSGIGMRPWGRGLNLEPVGEGDAILVSAPIGTHGIAILTARDGLRLHSVIESDCAALGELIGNILAKSAGVKWMRDPTRGGVAATLAELVEGAPFGVLLQEQTIPVREDVSAVCELLGFDPLHLANEGVVLMVVERSEAESVLCALRAHPLGRHAARIGQITRESAGNVRIETIVGGVRRVHRPAGELLPRIC